MSERSQPGVPTSDENPVAEVRYANCPVCKKRMLLLPQFDGYARPMNHKPYRFPPHAGNQFGRACLHSDELEQ